MPYNEQFADRIRTYFQHHKIDFYEQKMFGGVCFMVNDKMCCGTHTDKQTGEDLLLCRIGEDQHAEVIDHPAVIPMQFTGKAMKGYIYVTHGGHAGDADLSNWLNRCLLFNPEASTAKKKR